MNQSIRGGINILLRSIGLRLVNSEWGPRGFLASFSRLKALGHYPNIIYDVGASDGSWSGKLRSVFPDATYVLFEPLERHRAQLKSLSAANTKTFFHSVALGAREKGQLLNVHDGQSSFFKSSQWSGGKQDVPVKTIDSLVRRGECPPPDLIKADIQGYELEMLNGAAQTLESCSFLFLEVSWIQLYENAPSAGEVFAFLSERDFHVFDICSYSTRPLDQRLTQSDVCFAHRRTGLFDDRRWS